MRHAVRWAAALSVIVGLTLVAAPPASAEPDTRFASCKEMRVVDPNGVAINQRAIKRAVKQGFRAPLLCPVAYDANRRLDRDGDGVACERRK